MALLSRSSGQEPLWLDPSWRSFGGRGLPSRNVKARVELKGLRSVLLMLVKRQSSCEMNWQVVGQPERCS